MSGGDRTHGASAPAADRSPYSSPGGRDLALGPDGAWRPGWDGVVGSLLGLGAEELDRRQRTADRLMVAEGASAVLHDDVTADARPWRIDVAPLVLDAATWAPLAAGLVARAALLADVVADLQGPRELLRAGVIPVEPLAGHASLLASAWSEAPATRLSVVGADVVIDDEGRARVIADVTDVPSGDGHALLARAVSARVLPPVHPALGLVGHRAYTAALRATLVEAAPFERPSPRTVVVTGPPDDPGYVEDSYLLLGALRSVGLGARYVSGYLETEPPPGQPRLAGADASHAWVGLFVPGGGWVDFDPTNGLVQPDRHVTVAWGRDYADVVPVWGVVFGPPAAQHLTVSVDVAPV